MIKSYGRMLVPFIIAAVLCTSGTGRQQRQMDEEGRKRLEEAIHFAAVQCYAIEYSYPSDVKYLEENYGIYINRKKYAVFYNSFASNVLPDITVLLLR